MKIKAILTDMGLSFSEEKKFSGLKRKRQLRLDFYFELGGQKFAIEYQGELHYRSSKFMGGIKALLSVKESDRMKKEFLAEKNIHLIEITYKDFDYAENIIKYRIKKAIAK